MKYKIALTVIVSLHWVIAIGNIVALPYLATKIINDISNWYIYLPLITFIVVITCSRTIDCPLTKIENKLRKKLDLDQIQGFIKYYIIKPLKNFFN